MGAQRRQRLLRSLAAPQIEGQSRRWWVVNVDVLADDLAIKQNIDDAFGRESTHLPRPVVLEVSARAILGGFVAAGQTSRHIRAHGEQTEIKLWGVIERPATPNVTTSINFREFGG